MPDDTTFDARRDAAYVAREVLGSIEDVDAEAVVIVADWLLTGKATVALEFAQHRADNYSAPSGSPDAATWTPGLAEVNR